MPLPPTPPLPAEQVIPTGGSFVHEGHSFGNWKPMGPQSLVPAIAWSNDVYFYKLGLMLGPERIHEIGTALGVGVPTGIDIRLVVGSGITPAINTGIAHKQPGIGQVGAGIARAPLGCFQKAVRSFAQTVAA